MFPGLVQYVATMMVDMVDGTKFVNITIGIWLFSLPFSSCFTLPLSFPSKVSSSYKKGQPVGEKEKNKRNPAKQAKQRRKKKERKEKRLLPSSVIFSRWMNFSTMMTAFL